MFQQHFSNYLLEKQKISEAQHRLVQEEQQNSRVKLGLIAVQDGQMTSAQGEEINALQRQTDRRFGDLAIEKGYLSPEQIEGLLKKQGNPFLKLVQALTENEILRIEQIEEELNRYGLENGFSKEELQVLQGGDLNESIPVFLKTDHPLVNEYLGLVIRNIIRFINNRPRIKKVERPKEYSFSNLSFQEITGEQNFWLGFASRSNELLEIAVPFAQEEFEQIDDDSFDAVCEFINCINGLFASQLSYRDISLNMMPPGFAQNQKLKSEVELYVVPIVLNGKKIDLIAAVNSKAEII